MKVGFVIVNLCIALCMVSASYGQRFSCDGQLLIAVNDGVKTDIIRPIYIPFGQPFLSPMARYHNLRFDALGFNSKDNFIYGVQENTNAIVRLKRNNRIDTVGIVDIVETLNSNAGDCTVDGLFVCHEQSLNQLLVFNVAEEFELLERIDLFWDPQSQNSGPFETRIFDLAIDPNNPAIAYTHQGSFDHPDLLPASTRGYMLSINIDLDSPNVGMVTPIEPINPFQVSHLGALIFSPNSVLYGFGSADSGLIPEQDAFYGINPFAGTANVELTYPGKALSDGCSCPFSFTFINNTPAEGIFCSGDTKRFRLNITNNSFNDIENVTLTDTFPEGMLVEAVASPEVLNFGTISGLGTRFLKIENMTISAKSSLDINIDVGAFDAPIGTWENQAFLLDLPPRFDGAFASDNAFTSGVIGDPSVFFVTTPRLEDVSWEIIQPTDCLVANDGQIIISSPNFFPGQEFIIKLRNKIGWDEFTFNVTASDDDSFLLDSLIPGDYQVFELRSVNDNCSLALKDTTIILEAPNDQLQLSAGTNSPICEGDDLIFESTIFPDGEIVWQGPNLFRSEVPDTTIEDAAIAYEGLYSIEVEYGFCKQERELEVEVRPLIDVNLIGDSTYCERDMLNLQAKGIGEGLTFIWTGPNNLIYTDSIFTIDNVSSIHEGNYEVIASNGGCQDTADMNVVVLPTPDISLPSVLVADFCEPVILLPELSGDLDVAYVWSPAEGLSCTDCPNPQVQYLVQSEYQVNVENNYFCKDSAEIKVELDKEKLIHAPNVFYSNSSAQNDAMTAYPSCVVERILHFEVFNRWGSTVYSVDNPQNRHVSWDGFINGRIGASSVYIWRAKVELIDGSIEYLMSDVTLLR